MITIESVKGRDITFLVHGVSVTRQACDHITNETLAEHIEQLARDLAIEFPEKAPPPELTMPAAFAKGMVLGVELPAEAE